MLSLIRTICHSIAQKVIFLVLALFASGAFAEDVHIPMYFDVVGDGVTLLPIELDYDVTENDGNTIRMGPHKMDSGNFFADVIQASRLDSKLSPLLPKSAAKEWIFLFRWPEEFIHEGKLEMISRAGRVVWTREIREKDKKDWKAEMEPWKKVLSDGGFDPGVVNTRPIFNVQFGIRNIDKTENPFFTFEESFRLCFSRHEGPGMTRICTPQMQISKDQGRMRISPVPLSPQPARVIVLGEAAKLTDTLKPPMNKPISFYAENKYGMSYEFFALPRKLIVVDMAKTDEKIASIIVSGEEPMTPSVRVNKEFVRPIYEKIGWLDTIGDFRKFWRTTFNLDDPFIMIDGIGGGNFKQKFEITKLPSEDVRPVMDDQTVKTTYSDGVKVFGTRKPGWRVTTMQNSVQLDSKNPENYIWRFGAKKKGELNHSYLTFDKEGQSFRAYHEAYRGYQAELSTRLSTAIQSLEDYTILGEVAFNYWFEDLLGWSNYYLSRQRWGVSAKFFQSLTNFEITQGKEDLSGPIFNQTLDLKYRLEPGLWGRDETWGLIWGLQHFLLDAPVNKRTGTNNTYDSLMYGPGIFWARSMPKVFDRVANWFPFMNYPKWVDLEIIFYPLKNSPDVAVNGWNNFSMNFHGQVMWTKTIFGEAGFGWKRYDLIKTDEKFAGTTSYQQKFSTNSYYGTAGIGIRF